MKRERKYKENRQQYTGCWFYELTEGDRTYYCTYRKDEKLVTAKYGKKSKGYNLKGCSEFRADLMRGKEKTRQQKRADEQLIESRSIDKLYQRYLADKQGKGQENSRFYNWILPYWKDKNINQSTNTEAANYRAWLGQQKSIRGNKLSDQTVKHCIGLFRRIVRHAKRHIEGFVLLIDDFSIPVVHNEKTEDLSLLQLQSLLKVLQSEVIQVKRKDGKIYPYKVNRPVADMLLLILNTGMRQGELLKLQWHHVKYDRGTILLDTPKGGKDVTIQMNSVARSILKKQRKTSMYVFPGLNGCKRRHISKQARILRDLAGLAKDFRPCHGLRHFFGSELHAKGTNIKVISALMGHKSIEITKRYINVREEQKREAVELICIGGMK